MTDEQTGDSPVLRDLLGTVVKPRDRKPQKRQDRHMALICTKTRTVGDPLPHVESSPPNTLAEGTPPLALLCGRQPRSHRAYLLADGAYASRTNMQACQDMGIRHLIPVQTRCTARGEGTGDAWGKAVREQSGDAHRQH